MNTMEALELLDESAHCLGDKKLGEVQLALKEFEDKYSRRPNRTPWWINRILEQVKSEEGK